MSLEVESDYLDSSQNLTTSCHNQLKNLDFDFEVVCDQNDSTYSSPFPCCKPERPSESDVNACHKIALKLCGYLNIYRHSGTLAQVCYRW